MSAETLAQDRGPLEVVEAAADPLGLGQEHVVLDVEDAGGVVGALDRDAEPREPVAVVAQHRAVGRAVEGERHALHPVEEAREILARHVPSLEAAQVQECLVDRLPHLAGQRRADGPGILPAVCRQERIEDGLFGLKARKSRTVCSLTLS